MTATTKTSKATDSTAKLDDADPIDVNASTVDNNDKTEAPAKPPAATKQPEVSAKQQAMENASYELNQAREANDGYNNLGPLYVSAAPVANSLGAEFGFSTTDEKTNTVQRTGIGFYIRSDHLCNKRYDANVKVPVA
jgi:hypothetical protein